MGGDPNDPYSHWDKHHPDPTIFCIPQPDQGQGRSKEFSTNSKEFIGNLLVPKLLTNFSTNHGNLRVPTPPMPTFTPSKKRP